MKASLLVAEMKAYQLSLVAHTRQVIWGFPACRSLQIAKQRLRLPIQKNKLPFARKLHEDSDDDAKCENKAYEKRTLESRVAGIDTTNEIR